MELLLAVCFLASCGKVTGRFPGVTPRMLLTVSGTGWLPFYMTLKKKKKGGGCFSESARELTSNGYARGCALQDLSTFPHPTRCSAQVHTETSLQSLAEKWSVLPGIGTVGRGEGFREDFCVLSDVTQQGLPNHTKMQRKDSCKFLCGCMFRTMTKNSRGLFPQLSGSHVEVGLLAVKYGTT